MIQFIYNMIQADKKNALAEKRNLQAFEKLALADMEIDKQQEKTKLAIEKLSNRKKGILNTSMSSFLEIYEKIMNIDFVESDGIKELFSNLLLPGDATVYKKDVKIQSKELTTGQTIGAFIIKGGVSGVILKEAEVNANLASIRNRQADVVKSQSETICLALEAIETRAHKIAELLAKLNVLFKKSLDTTSVLIEEKGMNRLNYSRDDKEKIMTCINVASTIKKIIDTKILDSEGNIAKEAIAVMQAGYNYMEEINRKIVSGGLGK